MNKWRHFTDIIVTRWTLCDFVKSMEWTLYFEQCLLGKNSKSTFMHHQSCIHFYRAANERDDELQKMRSSNLEAKRRWLIIILPTNWGIMRGVFLWHFQAINKLTPQSFNKSQNNGSPWTNNLPSISHSSTNKENGWRKWCQNRMVRKGKPRTIGVNDRDDGNVKNLGER